MAASRLTRDVKAAAECLRADYQDATALAYLAKNCDAISTKFENVPAATLETLAAKCTVRPGAHALATAQDRIHEKTFLRDSGFPTARIAAHLDYVGVLAVEFFVANGRLPVNEVAPSA